MSQILDSRDEIQKLDASNALGSIESLADQIREAWQETKNIVFSPTEEIKNVVVAGMGGSGLGADVIQHVYKHELSVPFAVVNSYTLPGYVNENTLVLLSSYSGDTEEIISCAAEAESRNAQIMVIAAGGKLAEIAKEKGYPIYLIDPKSNPSNQPRLAIGNSVFGQIALLEKAGIISVSDEEVEQVITTVIATTEKCTVEAAKDTNQSKILAYLCVGRRTVLVTSEFLQGSVHVSANQFNENAKMYVDYKIVPELNHHLLEGLKYPESNSSTHIFVLLTSPLLLEKNQKRIELTQEVIEQNDIDTVSISLDAETKLAQVFESITIFAFTNFYVAMLEGLDPSPIPFVDWFKTELK